MAMQVSWSRPANTLVASVAGRIGGGNSADFQTALEKGIGEGERNLILDCRQLSYMSSAGLRVLLAMAKRFRGADQTIGICHLSDSIHAVISASGFDKIIPVHTTRSEALGAAAGSDLASEPEADDSAAGHPREAGAIAQIPIRDSINYDTVGDNIADIALFTVEKHEFASGDLPPEVRAEAMSEIRDRLWQDVERWKELRKEILAGMFQTAGTALGEVLERKA